MKEFFKNLKTGQVLTSVLFLFFVYLAIYLLINEPFDVACALIFFLFVVLVGAFWFECAFDSECSKPKKFYIVEVERWSHIKEDYEKIFFVEAEYEKTYFFYNHVYKKKIIRSIHDYKESNSDFKTDEEAMNSIINTVKLYITKSKKESGVDVKSIKTLKEITFDEVVALIEKSNAG